MYRIEFFFIKVLYFIFSKISFKTAKILADFFAFIIRVVIRYRRSVVLENLHYVYRDKLPLNQKMLLKKIYQNFTYIWFEMLQTTKISNANLNEHVHFHNLDLVYKEKEKNCGVIMMSGHQANFEWIPMINGLLDINFSIIAKRQRNPYVNDFIQRSREKHGAKIIYTKSAIREGIRLLRSGGVLGIVADQDARKRGVFVDFLGKPSSTAIGPAIFHIRSKAPMIMFILVRKNYAQFDVYLEPVPIPDDLNAGEEAIKILTQAHAAALEKWVYKYPDQWLWMHKRWKSKPLAAQD